MSQQQQQSSTASYKIFRRLPPFYTLQPNLQSQAKQIASWSDFILDVALAAFHQTGTLGIQVTPHSALFKSPKEVNRILTSNGARTVLKAMMENEGGNRCLPLSLEDDDDEMTQGKSDGKNNNNNNEDDDDDEFEDLDDNATVGNNNNNNSQGKGSIFANCDALIILAVPCEKIVKSIWAWHDELQTSNVFSVTEIAEDEDIKKRIAKSAPSSGGVATTSSGNEKVINDVGSLIVGEQIICDGGNNTLATNKVGNSSNTTAASLLHVTPLSAETVMGTIMTTEHPAMAHLKRPTLLSGSSGSLGLKFG